MNKQRQLRWDFGNQSEYYSCTGDHLSPLLLTLDILFSRLVDSGATTDDFMNCMDSIYNEIVLVLQSGATMYILSVERTSLNSGGMKN